VENTCASPMQCSAGPLTGAPNERVSGLSEWLTGGIGGVPTASDPR